MVRLLLLFMSAVVAAASPPEPHDINNLKKYTFTNYLQDFRKKNYDIHSEEYDRHQAIFDASLQQIVQHNARYFGNGKKVDAEDKILTHFLGVNEFTDQDLDDMSFGYDKSAKQEYQKMTGNMLKEGKGTGSDENVKSHHEMELPFDITPISTLPKSIDWRNNPGKTVVTAVKNQGGCGSCWAFASVEALESHVALSENGQLFDLSPQELVSCVVNKRKCGGTGGCAGATSELAYEYVAKYGIMDEYSFGYTSFHGGNGKCPFDQESPSSQIKEERSLRGNTVKRGVASIKGYANVPQNDYVGLMNAVAKSGPVVVAVAASGWGLYEGGVFSVDMRDSGKATDLNHAVVLVGYGTDKESGKDYWLVRNSWGPQWGEDGYIRLLRTPPPSPTDNEDGYCGIDNTPVDGSACSMDGSGNTIKPKPLKVCGTSGILYEGTIPVGAHVL